MGGHHFRKGVRAHQSAQLGVDNVVKPRLRAWNAAHGTVKLQGVDNPPARVVVQHDGFFVHGEGFARAGLVVQHAGVEVDHVLDKRDFHMQAGAVNPLQGVAQLQHQSLLGLVDGEKRLAYHHNQHQQHQGKSKRISAHYFFSSALGATGAPKPGRFR